MSTPCQNVPGSRPCRRCQNACQLGLVDDPPGQVGERGEHEPDRELADVAADEADRPEQREHHRDRAEQQRPEPRSPRSRTAGRRAGRRRFAMMISSKIDQPRHWTTFRTVARYEPRWPSGARMQHHRRHARVGADRPPRRRAAGFRSRRRRASRAAPCLARGRRTARQRRSRAARSARFPQSSSVSPARGRGAAPERARSPTRALLSPTAPLPSPVRTGSGSTGVISAWPRQAPR